MTDMHAAPPQPAIGDNARHGVSGLAYDIGEYVCAWTALFSDETQVARICAYRLLLAVLWVGFLAFGAVVAGDVLVAMVLGSWLQDLTSAVAATLLLNLLALFALLLAMRAWWHKLSLPRSRRALRELMRRLHETSGTAEPS